MQTLNQYPSTPESHQCGVCHEQYNDTNRVPRVVCKEIHNLCSECLQELLNQPGKKFACPFDRIESPKKSLNGYGVNRALLESIQSTLDILTSAPAKVCFHCSEEPNRLCLECDKVVCTECALDHHDGHKKHKLSDVPKLLADKMAELDKMRAELEGSTSGKEQGSKVLKAKEEELMQKADDIFLNYKMVIEEQRKALNNELKKVLGQVHKEYSKDNSSKDPEVLQWISKTANLISDVRRVRNPNSLLCSLHKQEKDFQKLDKGKVDASVDDEDAMLKRVLNQVSLQFNYQVLENFKRQNPVAVRLEINQNSVYHQEEEVKAENNTSFSVSRKSACSIQKAKSLRPSEKSCNESSDTSSDSNEESFSKRFAPMVFRQSHPVMSRSPKAESKNIFEEENHQSSQDQDWIENGSKSVNPSQEDRAKLRKAFDKIGMNFEVKAVQGTPNIRLDSKLDHSKPVPYGLNGDEAVSKFYALLCEQEYASSFKKVISLNLTCISLTKDGVESLASILKKLSSLQVIRVEFFKTGGLQHNDLKPFFRALTQIKGLTTLALTCQKWVHLRDFNLGYTFNDLVLNPGLKDLSLDFSECPKLTTAGLMQAFHSLRNLVLLENVQISMNGCLQVTNDEDSLRSIYQVYSNMKNLKEIQFRFEDCPKFSENGRKALKGPSNVKAGLNVSIEI